MSSSTNTGARAKQPGGKVNVACQTDIPYCSPPTVGAQVVPHGQCNDLGTSGSWKVADNDGPSGRAGSDSGTIEPVVQPVNGTVSDAASRSSAINVGSDDELSGEGVLRITVQLFSEMVDTLCSPSKRIRGVPWRIMVMPKQHLVQKKQQKCMGFFLQCCPDRTYSDNWSCKADAEMRLITQKQGVANFVRKTSHTYTAKENDWGYSCFMTWADVLDENQGYIKNDKVILEITVKSDWPKNMMSREEFCKSIDQWYNLAEMQMGRGLIDLSIEANNQALNFCKEKDEEMKQKLEVQRAKLVKEKVLASIDRISSNTPATSEPLKPTSLRQALTGAQKSIASKGTVKQPPKKDRRATMQQMKKKKLDQANKDKDIRRKTVGSEWDDNSQLSSMSSEERKSPSIVSPPDTPPEGNDEECHKKGSASTSRKMHASVVVSKRTNCTSDAQMSARSLALAFSKKSTMQKISKTSLVNYTHSVSVNGKTLTLPRDGPNTMGETFSALAKAVREELCAGRFPMDLHGGVELETDSTVDIGCYKVSPSRIDQSKLKNLVFGNGNAAEQADDECDDDDYNQDDVTDDSEDYREDDSMLDATQCPQCHARGTCVHDSMNSLIDEVAAVYVTENGCQTEDSFGHPNSTHRRERRTGMADRAITQINDQMGLMCEATQEVNQLALEPDHRADEIDRDRISKFVKVGLDNPNLELQAAAVQELQAVMMSLVDGNVSDSLLTNSSNILSLLDNLIDDNGTCCLAAGLCTVQSRRVYMGAREFCRVVSTLFNDDPSISASLHLILDPVVGVVGHDSNGIPVNRHGRKLATAVRRSNTNTTPNQVQPHANHVSQLNAVPVPSDFVVDLEEKSSDVNHSADTYESNDSMYRPTTPEFTSTRNEESYVPDYYAVGEEELESSIRRLMGDMGASKVDLVIAEKLAEMRVTQPNSALVTLLHQLSEYSQALTGLGDRMECTVDVARKIQKSQHAVNGMNAHTTELLRQNEERLSTSETLVKKYASDVMREAENRKKAELNLIAEQERTKEEREKTEQSQTQLKELRNQYKKLEKKAKQDEVKVASLQTDRVDLEEKNKAVKRDFEQFKKKAAEERTKAKKDKDRDVEQIRRLESDLVEKEAEKERERHSCDEKVREFRNKEIKWEKEKKHHQTTLTATIDRARVAEVAQLELTMSSGLAKLQKTKEEVVAGIADAEENLKRARTQADVDTMKRSMAEWRATEEELEKMCRNVKTDYETAIDSVKKGTRMLSQFTDLKLPAPVSLPKMVRLPPVQVVQPSTPVSLTPVAAIVAPPAGVIGQRALSRQGCFPNGVANDAQASSNGLMQSGVQGMLNNSFTRAPSPPAGSPFKGATPTGSPWSWNSPLGNLSDIRSDPAPDVNQWNSVAEPMPMRSAFALAQPSVNPNQWANQSWRAPQPQLPHHHHQQQHAQNQPMQHPHQQQHPNHPHQMRPSGMYYD